MNKTMTVEHRLTWFEDGVTDLYGWRCTHCADEFVGFSDPSTALNHGLKWHDEREIPAEAEAVEEDWSTK
jgi:hypothetical protein